MKRRFMDSPGQAPVGSPPGFEAAVQRLQARAQFGMVLGLERMEATIAALGHPERRFRSVHIAGSNGKGSTAVFCASILAAHGLRVGVFTSPHLVSVTERFRFFEGDIVRDVSPERFTEALERVEAVVSAETPFFEVMTAVAFVLFADEDVGVAIVEAGLGARLDATRVVPATVSVLTDLSLEHTDVLGDTIEAVAREEGAVIRSGRPVVMADGSAAAMAVVDTLAKDAGAEMFRIGERLSLRAHGDGTFDFGLHEAFVSEVRLSLRGRHQGRNALLAGQAAQLLEPELTTDSLRTGWSRAQWPGRMEVFTSKDGISVLLDGAQNAHAARALAEALEAMVGDGSFHFVFGVLSDKDASAMVRALEPWAASWTLTRPQTRRARDPETLSPLIAARFKTQIVEPASEALAYALRLAADDPKSGWVVVCGSLYLVGEVRPALTHRLP